MTHVAPRIVNSVSYVTRINDERHFSWQAQYLVSLDYMTHVAPHIVNNVSCVKRISGVGNQRHSGTARENQRPPLGS